MLFSQNNHWISFGQYKRGIKVSLSKIEEPTQTFESGRITNRKNIADLKLHENFIRWRSNLKNRKNFSDLQL